MSPPEPVTPKTVPEPVPPPSVTELPEGMPNWPAAAIGAMPRARSFFSWFLKAITRSLLRR